jgi:16S rRNA (cytosine967-C5)-methyltransferase
VQDEGSQVLGMLVDPQPGDEIVDLCAGAGGKTLQLASCVGPRGRIHAVDVDLSKLERLRHRAEKASAVVSLHGRALPTTLRASKILIDAPCSELGTLRRGPDLRWRVESTEFAALPALQRALLDTAVGHLERGGRMAYATCTIRREENDEVVRATLETHPHLRLVRPNADASLIDHHGFVRLFPHRHGTDAFFGAVFEWPISSTSSV